MTADIEFELNGEPVRIASPDTRRLIALLREDLRLTGAKEGCGTGECGACSVLIDGEIRLACLTLAGQIAGGRVVTIEGLSQSELGLRLLAAFVQAGAVQCGYCTPGMEIAAFDLLQREPSPSRERIREALSGNLCRCTGYVKIIDAVQQATGRADGEAR